MAGLSAVTLFVQPVCWAHHEKCQAGWVTEKISRKKITRKKIGGRNINNLRYADDTTVMAESEEELKSFLMRVKEESAEAGLKLNIQKMKITASSPITSWQIDGGKVETVTDFIFLGSQITAHGDCSHEIRRHMLLGRKDGWTVLRYCLRSFHGLTENSIATSFGFNIIVSFTDLTLDWPFFEPIS